VSIFLHAVFAADTHQQILREEPPANRKVSLKLREERRIATVSIKD
jgi:hypothetical protein